MTGLHIDCLSGPGTGEVSGVHGEPAESIFPICSCGCLFVQVAPAVDEAIVAELGTNVFKAHVNAWQPVWLA